jgi:membrane protein required for colicin V production
MSLDLIAALLLLLFMGIGAWRGTLATGAGVVTLAVSYLAAIMAAQSLGAQVAGSLGVPGVLGPVVAGSIGFAAAFVVCAVVTWALKRWDRGRRDGLPRSAFDRLGGAFFGALRGTLVVLLVALLVNWLDAARDMGVLSGVDAVPETEDSAVSEAAGRLIEKVVESALSDSGSESAPAARMMARIAGRPGDTLQSFQEIVEDDRVRRLSEDKLFWTLVENGAGSSAINQASFYDIVHDEKMRARMADLGLVPESAVEDPSVFRHAMGEMLDEIGPKLKGLRDDPEIRKLAEDPEIVQMLENGDTFALLTHPDIQRLVARVSDGN